MSLLAFKYTAAILTFFIAFIGGLWPFLKKFRRPTQSPDQGLELDFPLGESLATGIFFGAGLLHMLPDAAQDFFKAGYDYPVPFLIAALSFLLLLFLEHASQLLKLENVKSFSEIALLTTVMLSFHSFMEGAAVGLSDNYVTMFIIFMAIIAHKGAAAFALAIHINKSRFSYATGCGLFFVFALMTPIGILAGNWITLTTHAHQMLTPIFTSLAAGTFLYIGTLHGLDRCCFIKHCCNRKEFFGMLVGFSVMAIVAIWT